MKLHYANKQGRFCNLVTQLLKSQKLLSSLQDSQVRFVAKEEEEDKKPPRILSRLWPPRIQMLLYVGRERLRRLIATCPQDNTATLT